MTEQELEWQINNLIDAEYENLVGFKEVDLWHYLSDHFYGEEHMTRELSNKVFHGIAHEEVFI